MMFRAWGHPNMTAMHKTTLEFTKEADLSPKGDCIVGVEANFNTAALKRFVKTHKKVRIIIKTGALKEVITATTNPQFEDDNELVIRLGEYASPRTFAIRADKAAKYLNRELIKALQTGSPMEVRIEAAE